ncbi:MAG: RsmE family RNA methyltransferase [Planctomyces sp.]|jgi:16S rRNA (uracil1498-N3)-methyltransferase|nr:ribosomal RNA small subunit methyltransferase E [Planctomycetia bacterium]
MHWAWTEQLTTGELVISGPEAHHLLHVLRMKTGSSLILFDGNGSIADAVIQHTGRRDLTVLSQHIRRPPAALSTELTVAAAPPKGDRLRTMVEKLTEMGVHRLVLLETERSVTAPGETRVEKLRASVVAACKQARRPVLMELQPLISLPELLRQASADKLAVYAAHPAETTDPLPPPPVPSHNLIAPLLLIGPEGGFTDHEITLMKSVQARFMAWPGTILRTETAALVFATILLTSR